MSTHHFGCGINEIERDVYDFEGKKNKPFIIFSTSSMEMHSLTL